MANSSWNIHNFRQNVIDLLLDKGHSVTVIAPKDKYTPFLKNQKIQFIPLVTLDRDTTSPRANWALYKECKEIYARLQLDLIIHYTSKPIIFGGRAAYKNGIPSVAIITGLGYAFIRRGWLQLITRQLYRSSAKYHQRFIFENKDDLQLFEDHFITADKGVSVLGCGVDQEHFKPSGLKSIPLTFTYIGRLLKDKGIEEFIAAAAQYKDDANIRFKVVGDLDEENPSQITQETLLSWINDELIQYVSFKEDIRDEIAKASCVVLPSYREGMPRTILEAMSMERPVIVSDVPGCRETVINGKNGFLCKPRDVNSLVKAIEQFRKLSPSIQKEMGVSGREMILSGFTSKQISEAIYKVITPLL